MRSDAPRGVFQHPANSRGLETDDGSKQADEANRKEEGKDPAVAESKTGTVDESAKDPESNPSATPAWPTDHLKVTSGYSLDRVDPVTGKSSRPHLAIDIRNPKGDPVYSILDGTVSAVGTDKRAGNYIKVDHADGLQSSSAHTKATVATGDSVTRGQQIGISDASGRGTAPHLHLTIRRDGERIDPCTVLQCP